MRQERKCEKAAVGKEVRSKGLTVQTLTRRARLRDADPSRA